MTERGAALEAGDIEAVVTVALLSQWFDGAPRGYLKRNINTNIMQQGVGVDSPTVILSNGEHIGGALTSNEMKRSKNLPLLFSLAAQATLGLQKDTRSGKCYLPDYGAELKLYEVEGSESASASSSKAHPSISSRGTRGRA